MLMAHHPKDDLHRLYIKRKEGGRALINIEESVGDVHSFQCKPFVLVEAII